MNSAAGWKKVPLGDVLTFQRGFDITQAKQVPGPYAVISSSGPNSTHSEFMVQGPGVVIGRKGSLGTVFYSEEPFWPHDTTLWVKDFHGNVPRFAYYFLKTMGFERYDAGASNPTLNRNHIHTIRVAWPTFNAQRRIASILSAYDDLIENNARRIQILEQMAHALYREWFVEFGFPGHEDGRQMASSLGPIPEGWDVKPLGAVLQLNYGRALKEGDRRQGSVPVFGSSGIVGYHDSSLVDGPGLIVGRKGNVGSIFWTDVDFYPIDTVFYVTTPLPLRFLFYNLQDKNFLNNDAAVPGLNRNQAYSLETILPPDYLVRRFCEIADALEAQASLLGRTNGVLRRTRDLLLPRLLSGQITLDEAAA